jgi:hypothetical protein
MARTRTRSSSQSQTWEMSQLTSQTTCLLREFGCYSEAKPPLEMSPQETNSLPESPLRDFDTCGWERALGSSGQHLRKHSALWSDSLLLGGVQIWGQSRIVQCSYMVAVLLLIVPSPSIKSFSVSSYATQPPLQLSVVMWALAMEMRGS